MIYTRPSMLLYLYLKAHTGTGGIEQVTRNVIHALQVAEQEGVINKVRFFSPYEGPTAPPGQGKRIKIQGFFPDIDLKARIYFVFG